MLTFTTFGPTRDCIWNGLKIPRVSALVMDLEDAEVEFMRRYEPFGDHPKNLYRSFVIDGRKRTELQLCLALRRRARLNLVEWCGSFERICKGEAAGTMNGARQKVHRSRWAGMIQKGQTFEA
jgi:hypothetical protein